MNYIQYMKPGSKFWALPNGQEDVSWSEFWNNWKKAIAKAKEQIVDNWENLKQDYKDAADPIAASERKQAESIEATRAKQASIKFVSDNRTDYEKKRDRKNFKLKEFEQKEQQNKDATDAVMWTLTGIPYAVQHLASPNGVVKTYGNTKAAVQNGGGPYLEKAVASAAGDVLDATILAAPLFTPKARLARAMNKNIRSAKFTNTPIYHGSTFTGPSAQFNGRTAEEVGLHFADSKFPGNYRLRVKEMPKGSNMREGVLTYTQYNQPLQINDRGIFDLTSFNQDFVQNPDLKKIFNAEDIAYLKNLGYTNDAEIAQLLLKESGKDLIYQNATEINPGWSYLTASPSKLHLNHYAPLPQTDKITPTKTSLAFFERQPAKISKGERLGIPKGQERTIINNEEEILNNAKSFAEKYGYEIPETIDAAKTMYNQHNSFFRTPSDHESVILHYDPELAKLPLEQQYFKLASKGYPESMRSYDFSQNGIYNDDFVFVAPDYGEVMPYINDVPAVMLRRPFRKSNPLTWHKDAEWTIQSKYTPYDQVFGKNKIGTAQIGNAGPQHEFKVSTRYLQPVKIAEPADKGTLLGIHLGPYGYKSGGTIHIKKKNKGKFTDYCGGKVTEECIRKGKNSSNPTTRKRANFAWVARHKFKHEEGGKINYLNIF